jgi:hypothetical protein
MGYTFYSGDIVDALSVPKQMTKAGLCLAVICLLLSKALLAQSSAQPGSPQWYFQSVTVLPPADASTREASVYLQNLHAVGRQDLHAALPNRVVQAAPCPPWPATADAVGKTIAAQLAELARNTTIVIVNEAHDESRHRELIRQLAVELRRQGFTYYAAETLAGAPERAGEPFGRSDAGYYTLEPAFGQLLRTVKELKYRLVAYEDVRPADPAADRAVSMERREEGQAENLMTRIFAAEPQAKVLIHVGYSHAAEVALPNFGGSLEWMAARLKAKTGVDPLTIDQFRCASPSADLELAAISGDLPPGAHDVAVAYPPTVLFRGRPQWRIYAGAIAVELPDVLVTANQRSLIEARFDSEPADAIPLDRLLLWPGERLPLLLPAGKIRIQQYFEDRRAPRTLLLNVEQR